MATIEPRLIHLLNNSTTPELSNTDLPPFHSLPFSDSDRHLPPLDRDANQTQPGSGRYAVTADAPKQQQRLVPHHHHLSNSIEDDGPAQLARHSAFDETSPVGPAQYGAYAGSSDPFPLRILLRESDAATADLSYVPRISDDAALSEDPSAANKKRTRAIAGVSREEYLQLPQPVKKQKPAVHHASVVPPIINGLHEPPPHAALFPPIAPDSFGERDSGHLESLHSSSGRPTGPHNNGSNTHGSSSPTHRRTPEAQATQQQQPPLQQPQPQPNSASRKRATKPRRKWSEDETNHLLLGVSKHGVGKWRAILNDPEFKFNSRSAGDLKDRFRTCCPAELRETKSDSNAASPTTPHRVNSNASSSKGLYSENILHHQDGDSSPGTITPPTEAEPTATKKKTRAHRKNLADLEDLGIHAPFKKSLRRERKPFTDQDDREILEGLSRYGPAWTKILRDPNFHLLPRRPTDLRDRVRNRYPEIYHRIEKGTYQTSATKDSSGGGGNRNNDIMEPSVTMRISNSLTPGQHQGQTKGHGLELADAGAAQYLNGEMDISRLLLDDSR